MRIIFSSRAWAHYTFWFERNPAVVTRINELIEDARRHPFTGIGRPEPLRGELRGFWSRRIDREHRLVYRAAGSDEAQALEIASCRFHYER
jgi:toxin YoeB